MDYFPETQNVLSLYKHDYSISAIAYSKILSLYTPAIISYQYSLLIDNNIIKDAVKEYQNSLHSHIKEYMVNNAYIYKEINLNYNKYDVKCKEIKEYIKESSVKPIYEYNYANVQEYNEYKSQIGSEILADLAIYKEYGTELLQADYFYNYESYFPDSYSSTEEKAEKKYIFIYPFYQIKQVSEIQNLYEKINLSVFPYVGVQISSNIYYLQLINIYYKYPLFHSPLSSNQTSYIAFYDKNNYQYFQNNPIYNNLYVLKLETENKNYSQPKTKKHYVDKIFLYKKYKKKKTKDKKNNHKNTQYNKIKLSNHNEKYYNDYKYYYYNTYNIYYNKNRYQKIYKNYNGKYNEDKNAVTYKRKYKLFPEQSKEEYRYEIREDKYSYIIKNDNEYKKEFELPHEVVVLHAQRERLYTMLNLFKKYQYKHKYISTVHEGVIESVCSELYKKRMQKGFLIKKITDYFDSIGRSYIKMHEQSRFQPSNQQNDRSQHSSLNLSVDFKDGISLLWAAQDKVLKQQYNLGSNIIRQTIPHLFTLLNQFNTSINAQTAKYLSRQQYHSARKKIFYKQYYKLYSQLSEFVYGTKIKIDIFVELTKIINYYLIYRNSLKYWGKSLISFRQAFIIAYIILIEGVYRKLLELKNKSVGVYYNVGVGTENIKKYKNVRKGYKIEISMSMSYAVQEYYEYRRLCALTDIDFVQHMREVQYKQKTEKMSDEHFEEYLELRFFSKVVGSLTELLRGTSSKCFPLYSPNEELVHTISGNLVHFDRRTLLCKQIFSLNTLNVRLLGDTLIEFHHRVKGWLFNDTILQRLKLKDRDRAEELLCLLYNRTSQLPF